MIVASPDPGSEGREEDREEEEEEKLTWPAGGGRLTAVPPGETGRGWPLSGPGLTTVHSTLTTTRPPPPPPAK